MQLIQKTEEKPKCTGVSWGHFTMKEPLREDLGTSSLGSCFAFVVLDSGRDQVFFAHVSNDTETTWLIDHLLKPPSDFLKKLDWKVKYYAITGVEPQKTTADRIASIEKYLGHNYLEQGRAKTGAVVLQSATWKTKPTFHVVKDVDAINSENYANKNKIGMGHAGGLLPMPGSEFVSTI